jgi:hypothetical protein
MARAGQHRGRCVVCRKRFLADVRAGERQKVCSAACRVVRRRKQAKQRRAQDIEAYRASERERQRMSRRQRRASTQPPPAPEADPARIAPLPPAPSGSRGVTSAPSRPLSRASLARQPAGIREEILRAWDKAADLSRAGLVHDLARIFGDKAPLLGETGA